MLDGVQEHLDDAVTDHLVFFLRQQGPYLVEHLNKEDVSERLIIVIGGIDAYNF